MFLLAHGMVKLLIVRIEICRGKDMTGKEFVKLCHDEKENILEASGMMVGAMPSL